MKKLNVFSENSCGSIDDLQELFKTAKLNDIVKVLSKVMNQSGLAEMHVRTNLEAYIFVLDKPTITTLNNYRNDSGVLKLFFEKHRI